MVQQSGEPLLFPVLRRLAHTPPNPWDTRFPPCVGCVCDWASFSLVCALPSAGSAEVLSSLFVSFIGTMAQSDSSKTYISGSWVFHLLGPVCSRRRSGGLPVLVHTVC